MLYRQSNKQTAFSLHNRLFKLSHNYLDQMKNEQRETTVKYASQLDTTALQFWTTVTIDVLMLRKDIVLH